MDSNPKHKAFQRCCYGCPDSVMRCDDYWSFLRVWYCDRPTCQTLLKREIQMADAQILSVNHKWCGYKHLPEWSNGTKRKDVVSVLQEQRQGLVECWKSDELPPAEPIEKDRLERAERRQWFSDRAVKE